MSENNYKNFSYKHNKENKKEDPNHNYFKDNKRQDLLEMLEKLKNKEKGQNLFQKYKSYIQDIVHNYIQKNEEEIEILKEIEICFFYSLRFLLNFDFTKINLEKINQNSDELGIKDTTKIIFFGLTVSIIISYLMSRGN